MKTSKTVRFETSRSTAAGSKFVPHAGKVGFRTTEDSFNVCPDCGEVLNPFDTNCSCGAKLQYISA